jgi:hypothetical protein
MGEVLSALPFRSTWEDHVLGTVVTWRQGKRVDISAVALLNLDEIIIAAWKPPTENWSYFRTALPPMQVHPQGISLEVHVVSFSDIPRFAHESLARKLVNMNLIDARTNGDLRLFHFSTRSSNPDFSRVGQTRETRTAWIGNADLRGGASRALYFRYGLELRIFDRNHPIIRWLRIIGEHLKDGLGVVRSHEVETIWEKITGFEEYEMDGILERWSESETIPSELKPPKNNEGRLVDFDHFDLANRRTVVEESA